MEGCEQCLCLDGVVGDGDRPAVCSCDRLIQRPVQVSDLRPGAFLDAVVENGQADLVLDADRLPALD